MEGRGIPAKTASDFGVRFWFTTAHVVNVDYVKMQVYYTVPDPMRQRPMQAQTAVHRASRW